MLRQKTHMVSFLALIFFYVLFVATTVNHPGEEAEKNHVMSEYDLSVANGRYVFVEYCQPCHVSSEEHATDNPFNGLFDRLPAPADTFFVKFVSDSKALRDSGNSYANAIHQSWKRNYDHKFKYVFAPKEFAGLIIYIRHCSKTPGKISKQRQ